MEQKIGEKEQAVRDSLKNRPCGILYQESYNKHGKKGHGTISTTFTGICCAPMSTGILHDLGEGEFLKIGKAEAEWGWPENHEILKRDGLIDFEIVEIPGRLKTRRELQIKITEKGMTVRKDDLEFFVELLEAMDEDRRNQE